MFSSNSNGNNPNVSYTDQAIFHGPFLNDVGHDSKQEDPPSSFFHFPYSPFIHNEDIDFFLQHPHDHLLLHHLTADNTVAAETVINMEDSNNNNINGLKADCNKKSHIRTTEQILPRKRSSKRDRHSKINTAQGPRDRRMRLSLEVARRFFDLQDMLGFDKASKTVEWLLMKSKVAIKELIRGLPHSCSVGAKSASSTSECEVVSGIDEIDINGSNLQGMSLSISEAGRPSTCVISKEKKIRRQSRKAAFHPLARESRVKARARARERTREKQWSRRVDDSKLWSEPSMDHDLNRLGSWSPFDRTGEEESGTQSHNKNAYSLEVLADVEEIPRSFHDQQQQQVGTAENIVVDDSLVITAKWSPPLILNYQHNTGISQAVSSNNKFPNLSEIWDIDGARTYPSYCTMTNMHLSSGNVQEGIPNSNFLTTPYNCLQHQLPDFQIYGKQWEAYNNINLC